MLSSPYYRRVGVANITPFTESAQIRDPVQAYVLPIAEGAIDDPALRTMEVSEQFRGLRVAAKDFAPLAAGAEAVGKHRIVYDAKEGRDLPGTQVRSEGDPPTGDNSVDEALVGFATEIEVTVFKDGSVEVIDDGRGMPVDIHPKHKISGDGRVRDRRVPATTPRSIWLLPWTD